MDLLQAEQIRGPEQIRCYTVLMFGIVLVDALNVAKTRTLARTQSILCMGTRLGMRARCSPCMRAKHRYLELRYWYS